MNETTEATEPTEKKKLGRAWLYNCPSELQQFFFPKKLWEKIPGNTGLEKKRWIIDYMAARLGVDIHTTDTSKKSMVIRMSDENAALGVDEKGIGQGSAIIPELCGTTQGHKICASKGKAGKV
jgi:hypothetical protein